MKALILSTALILSQAKHFGKEKRIPRHQLEGANVKHVDDSNAVKLLKGETVT